MNSRHKRKSNSSLLCTDIMVALQNGAVHTQKSLADKFEVSVRSIYNAIQLLKSKHNIITYCGGVTGGGVYLDEKQLQIGLTKERVAWLRRDVPAVIKEQY